MVERINSLIASKDKAQMGKLAEILGNQYSYGDLDVRSVITIVILNSISSDYIDMKLFKNGSYACIQTNDEIFFTI